MAGRLIGALRDAETEGTAPAKTTSGLMPACVEDCLRDVSPVQLTKPRFAVRDLVGQGRLFHCGDKLAGFFEAVNCDPAKFDMPDDRDSGRRPNPQLSAYALLRSSPCTSRRRRISNSGTVGLRLLRSAVSAALAGDCLARDCDYPGFVDVLKRLLPKRLIATISPFK